MAGTMMSKYLNYAYLFGLMLLAFSLPLSMYFTSVAMFFLGTVWLVSMFVFPVIPRLRKEKSVWIFILLYVIHLIWLLNTQDYDYAFEDLRKKLPLFVLPLIIAGMPTLGKKRLSVVLHTFIFGVLIGTFTGAFIKLGFINVPVDNSRDISIFISHIRFSLMIILACFVLGYYAKNSAGQKTEFWLYIAGLLWLLLFMVILQSLTGIIILLITTYFLLPSQIRKLNDKRLRQLAFALMIILPVSIAVWVFFTGKSLYKPKEEITKNALTKEGRRYAHSFNSPYLENGHYVYRYLCDPELKSSWEKRSKISIDSLDKRGQPLYHTLVRYMTSKGLLKDKQGIEQLSETDIQAVENGVCNYRFAEKRGLQARLYYLIWQIHIYVNGGNPSGHSITQRLEYLKTGWHIASENVWLGVGTGDVNKEFKKAYVEMQSPLHPKYRMRSHNQYLSLFIAFGIFGFILCILALFLPPLIKRKYHNYFFMVFFIIALLSMCNEDTLETHTGASFIAFFYSLFLWGIKMNEDEKSIHATGARPGQE